MLKATNPTAFMGVVVLLSAATTALAQESAPRNPAASTEQRAKADLSVEQAQLADRWDRLEQIAARLAELSASSDPHRADLLRKAIAQAREKEVRLRFEAIVNLLENERYSIAATNQETLETELQQLLELLLKENRAEELRSHQAWLRMQLKEVNRIIRLQRGVKARTEGGDDTDRLADDQEKIGERTGGLADQIQQAQGGSPDGEGSESGSNSQADQENRGSESESENNGDEENGDDSAQPDGGEDDGKNDGGESNEATPSEPGPASPQESQSGGESQPGGEPQEGQPSQGPSQPGQPGQPSPGQGSPSEGSEGESSQGQQQPSSNPDENLQRRLRAAQENMEQARQKLEETERSGATEEQEKALRELEEARAELERILRQLREEEMERTLALLEVRFRRMLELQIAVYEGTQRLDRVPQETRDHDDEIEAGRLSRQEEAIAREADKALEILLEEGTSVAFPEAVTQMRADMQDVAERLARVDVGKLTQGVEEDIIEQLEETIEALQQALEDLEKNGTPPGQSPPPGEPQDPPLVDMLEEVKMIRALQMRINRRTRRYAEMIDGSIASEPEMIDALRNLAERQQRVHKATGDLHLGKNR